MTAQEAPVGARKRFYFNLRSPYSWLANHDLAAHDVADLEWLPYWEPDEHTLRLLADADGRYHYAEMPRAKNMYILQDVRRLAAARGLSPRWPVDRAPHWEVPHLGYLHAAAHDRGAEYVALAHRARWERGEDICAPATVGRIGAELGLDPEATASAWRDPGLRADGVAALLSADRDGVFGVPFFVNGRQKFWGVDRLADFVASAARAPVPAALSTVALSTADDGHAGGCG
jgi:2-hydroxychromene-2-carboxylate isomerase